MRVVRNVLIEKCEGTDLTNFRNVPRKEIKKFSNEIDRGSCQSDFATRFLRENLDFVAPGDRDRLLAIVM